MNKKIIISLFLTLTVSVITVTKVFTFAYNPPMRKTGAPDETTCNESFCHNSYATNDTSGKVSLQLLDGTQPVTNYQAGKIYNVKLSAKKTAAQIFGFQSTVLNMDGERAGLSVSLDQNVKTSNSSVNGKLRRYAYHAQPLIATNDSFSVDYQWDAPSPAMGKVIFYVSTNAANNNGNALGDYIFTNTFEFDVTVGVNNAISSAKDIYLFPNPAHENINLHFNLLKAAKINFQLFSMSGKLVQETSTLCKNNGTQTININVENLARGIYISKFTVDDESLSKKILLH